MDNRRRMARAKRRVRYAILDRKDTEERRQMLPYNDSGYQQTSLMVSESESEEEILFQTKKEESGTVNGSMPLSDVQIRTNHRLTNGSTRISNST